MARLLGVDAFGDYAYAFTLLNIVAILSTRGMDAAGVRFVPAYSVKQQWRLLRGFLRHSKSIVLMTSSVISLLSLALIFVFRDALGPSLAGTMAFACLILPVFSLGQVLSSILLGFDRVVVARAPLEILRFLFLILFAFFFFQLLTMPPTAPLGMVFNLAATLITIGILMLGLRRAVPGKTKSAGLEYSKKQWNSVAWQMFLGAGFILVLNRTGIVLVGIFLGTTDAGIYYVASHLTTLILLGLQSVNYIVGPMISRLHTAGRHAELQRMTTISTWAIMLVTLPLCIGLLILCQFALSLFGSEFTVGYAALFILVLGQTVSALVGPVGLLTSMTGHQHVTAIVQGVGAGLNVRPLGRKAPKDVRALGTALDDHLEGPANLAEVAGAIVRGLEAHLSRPEPVLTPALLDELDRHDWLRDRRAVLTVPGHEDESGTPGVCVGIAPDGALLFRPDRGALRRVQSGSVTAE